MATVCDRDDRRSLDVTQAIYKTWKKDIVLSKQQQIEHLDVEAILPDDKMANPGIFHHLPHRGVDIEHIDWKA